MPLCFSLQATNSIGDDDPDLGGSVLVKLPYTGTEKDIDKIKLITSTDGKQWTSVDAANILVLHPQSVDEDGYLVFSTSHFSYYTITQADESNVSAAVVEASSSSGGGSVTWLLFLLPGLYVMRLRKKK